MGLDKSYTTLYTSSPLTNTTHNELFAVATVANNNTYTLETLCTSK